MAAGKAVVATNVGDNCHVIDDGIDGFLVPKADARAIADKLECLVMDRALRASLGERALAKVQREGTTSLMVSNYEKLYLRLLDDSTGR